MNAYLLQAQAEEGFFSSILGFLSDIYYLIANLLSSIKYVFQYLISTENFVLNLSTYLPVFIYAMLVVVLGVYIINYIIGR